MIVGNYNYQLLVRLDGDNNSTLREAQSVWNDGPWVEIQFPDGKKLRLEHDDVITVEWRVTGL